MAFEIGQKVKFLAEGAVVKEGVFMGKGGPGRKVEVRMGNELVWLPLAKVFHPEAKGLEPWEA